MTTLERLAADPRVTALAIPECQHCPRVGRTSRGRSAQWRIATMVPGGADYLLCGQHAVAELARRDRLGLSEQAKP